MQINNPYFYIQDYKFEVKDKSHQFQINSEFEILGNFELPKNLISIEYNLPNQKIKNNFININKEKTCKTISKKNLNCYVFENTSYAAKAADKFFAREIVKRNNIYINANFSIEKDLLRNEENTKNFEKENFEIFFDNVEKQKFNFFFQYENTHIINKEKNSQKLFEILIFESFQIDKNKTIDYIRYPLKINFSNLNQIQKLEINDVFNVFSESDLIIETLNQKINFQDQNKEIQTINFSNLDQFIEKSNNIHQFTNKQIIPFHEKIKETVKNQGKLIGSFDVEFLIHKNQTTKKVKISNFFEYKKDFEILKIKPSKIIKDSFNPLIKQYKYDNFYDVMSFNF